MSPAGVCIKLQIPRTKRARRRFCERVLNYAMTNLFVAYSNVCEFHGTSGCYCRCAEIERSVRGLFAAEVSCERVMESGHTDTRWGCW